MVAIVERCPARAALAGNPSDGYGGAVLATPVRTRQVTVTIRPGARFRLTGDDGTADVATTDDLVIAARSVSADDPHALVLAAIAVSELSAPGRPAPEPFSIDVTTSIPRSVGLAGSSAIVIATLRALGRLAGRPERAPAELASLALHVERDVLGIAAGLQDRVVQAFDRPMMMRFGHDDRRMIGGFEGGRYEAVTMRADLALFVACRPRAATPSHIVHADLRARFDGGDPIVRAAMADLATEAERAAAAVAGDDIASLGVAIDRSFDLRRSITDLDPAHVEMVEVARQAGAHANYSGSGGAVSVLCPDPAVRARARAALTAIGCELIDLT